jgi:hypothetical protein
MGRGVGARGVMLRQTRANGTGIPACDAELRSASDKNVCVRTPSHLQDAARFDSTRNCPSPLPSPRSTGKREREKETPAKVISPPDRFVTLIARYRSAPVVAGRVVAAWFMAAR